MNPLSYIKNIFFPSRCVICDKVMPKDIILCKECSEERLTLPEKGARCDICFMKLSDCCCGKRTYYNKITFPLKGTDKTKKAVYKIKYSSRLDKILPFSKLILLALQERNMLESVDIITFIPMSKKSKRKRGFNQSEELAHALSKLTGIICNELLYKYFDTGSQHLVRGAIARSGNLLGAYEPYKDKTDIIKGKTILIVDDIMTTGNTFNEAAKTLLIFGADKVYCASAIISEKYKKG